MKNFEYHYKTEPCYLNEVIFEFPKSYSSPYWAFGDQISILNMHLYFNKVLNLNGKLSICDINDEDELHLANLFFKDKLTKQSATHLINVPKEDNIICNEFGENEYHNFFREIYKNDYIKIIEQTENIKKQITYSCEANSFVDKKTPLFFNEGIKKLKEIYQEVNFVEVGKKIKLKNTLKMISESMMHIGIDNGVSHLCRCTNTPYLLIEYKWDVCRGFPEKYCNYMKYKTYDEMINLKF